MTTTDTVLGPYREVFFTAYRTLNARHQFPTVAASMDDTYNIYTQQLVDDLLAAIKIAATDELQHLSHRTGPGAPFYKCWPGEHYRLLHGLIQVLQPKTVIEIGTSTGMSAMVMQAALPKGSKLVTFDIDAWNGPQFTHSWLKPEDFQDGSLRQEIGNLQDPELFKKHYDLFANAEFIFIDGPKSLTFERIVLAAIVAQQAKTRRVVFFDDIKGPLMNNFWRDIKLPKLDATSFGHWSGTGLIDLQPI